MTYSKTFTDKITKIIKESAKPMRSYTTNQNKRIKMIPGLKAVFFDIYGTMLISGTGDIGISEEKNKFQISIILSDFSFILESKAEKIDERFSFLFTQLIKNTHLKMNKNGIDYPEVDIVEIWRKILTILIKEKYISGTIDKEKIMLIALTYENIINPVWPMEGIKKILEKLYKSELKLGIISNAQFYTQYILKTLLNFKIGNNGFNSELLFYSYNERLAKPSKDFFLKAVTKAKKLYNIEPEEILYIGNDMLNDIYTASICGCKTALFAGDQRSLKLRSSDSRCKNLKPDLILTDFNQFLEFI